MYSPHCTYVTILVVPDTLTVSEITSYQSIYWIWWRTSRKFIEYTTVQKFEVIKINFFFKEASNAHRGIISKIKQ